MSMQHHSGESPDERRFIDELMGQAQRRWPHGRISGDDDGVTAYAIAADPAHKIVRIQFTKPMMWLGLDVQSATQLRDALTARLAELAAAGVTK